MPNIFISYRRDDSPANARLLHDQLQAAFPRHSVFMDVKKIRIGDNWKAVLREQIDQADVVLVVIGPNWLDVRDKQGQRRLDDEGDFVRWEIAEAIRLGKVIVPLQVDGAAMPASADLPEDIAGLPGYQGQVLSHLRFEDDVQTLIARLQGSQSTADFVQLLSDRLRLGKAGAFIAAMVITLVAAFAWSNLFDLLGLDTRSASFTMLIGDVLVEPELSDDLLLVAIRPTDQESRRLDPSRRLQYAALIDLAVAEGARRIAFDITLVDPSDNDDTLRQAIDRANARGVPVVFGFNAVVDGQPFRPPDLAGSTVVLGLTCVGDRLGNVTYGNLVLQSGQGVYGSLPFHAAMAPAVIDPLPAEGTLQRYRTRDGTTADVRFSLLETVSVADAECPARTPGSTFARLIVPLSHKERWRDPARRVSIEEALNESSSQASRLGGKVVLVGAEHPVDVLKTRLDGNASRYGFEFHADVINALLTGQVVRPVSFTVQWLFAAFTIGIAIAWRRHRFGKSARADKIVLTALCATLVAVAVGLYAGVGLLIDSLYHMAALLVTWWLLAMLERRWRNANR
ncbi:MAG: CHASE2 domain-containing protein [Gammaproteobacteria bacterium]|nr:CHASE2 domain-containing protein [Gammaproteobacteria bacterium]